MTYVGSKRHVKANNKEMGKLYNPKQESSYITYVDANNLYGWAMSEALPHKDIKFDDTVKLEDMLATPDDASTGYMVEAVLESPPELHDKFKQFPPCPENIKPLDEWMNEWMNG